MKRILIIGASILQLPAILKAKEMGYYVATADYNPEAVGIPFADEYFNVSTIDVDGVVKAAQEFGADGIMTLATDMPMRAVARACEVLGLNGISFETAVKATDKGEMIKAFEEHGVEHPWYFVAKDPDSFEQIFDKVTYPCIMKPTDNAGSRGVVKCNSAEELREAYSYSSGESRGGAVIVEEYLQGPEFSIEVMVTDGVPHVLQITDKCTTGAPHFVELEHHQPANLSRQQYSEIYGLTEKALDALGVTNGASHAEYKITEEGKVYVMEIGARMGGDFIGSDLVKLSTGYDFLDGVINVALGQFEEPVFGEPHHAGVYFLCEETKQFLTTFKEAKQPQLVRVEITDEVLRPVKCSADRSGYLIYQGNEKLIL